jgi:diguanylate cyclase (GGDEF)-like protein
MKIDIYARNPFFSAKNSGVTTLKIQLFYHFGGKTMRKILYIIFSFILIYILGYYLWLTLGYNKDNFKMVAHLFSFGAPLIGTVCLFMAFYKSGGHSKLFWFFLSAGGVSYLFAELVWSYYELILKTEVSFPSFADMIYLLAMLFQIIAVLVKLNEDRNKNNVKFFRFIFDILIIMTVAITLSWYFIIQPVLDREGILSIFVLVYVGYPILDLLLLSGMSSLIFSSKLNRVLPKKILFLILLSFGILIIADTAYMIEVTLNTYSFGNLIDPLWSLTFLLLGAASFLFVVEKDSYEPINSTGSGTVKIEYISFRRILPYLAVFILLFIQLVMNNINSLSVGFSIAIMLIIFRQLFILWENESLVKKLQKLNDVLEEKVLLRTSEITTKNAELQEMLNHIEHLANYDALCDIPNRRYFEMKLNQLIDKTISEESSLALLFFDLDRFKAINDTYGHSVADLLLKEIGERLKLFAKEDYFISRLGGDEFTVLIEDARDKKEVVRIVEELQQSLAEAFFKENTQIDFSISIGIAFFPADASNAEQLIQHADAAMYQAKASGRNNYQLFIGFE